MPDKVPVISIQCDWDEVIKLPREEGWISSKYISQDSTHEKFTTSLLNDGKVKINLPNSYQFISNTRLSLVIKHVSSNLKVAFVAPTKNHIVHKTGVLSVSASEKTPLVVSSCEGDKLLVWDSRTSEVLLNLAGHGGPVYSCRFFPSGVVILTASADGTMKVWCAETGINPVTLVGHKMAVMDTCVVEKGRNVISVSRDGSAILWDIGESRILDHVAEGLGVINCCTLGTAAQEMEQESPSEREIGTKNKLVILGCESGSVVGVHVGGRSETFHTRLDEPCNACAVMNHTVIVGCHNGTIFQLNIETGEIIRQWEESANPVICIEVLCNELFAVGRQDGSCTVFSLADGLSHTRVQLTGSHFDGIRDIAFNGKWIFTACRDTHIRKYDFNQVAVHFK